VTDRYEGLYDAGPPPGPAPRDALPRQETRTVPPDGRPAADQPAWRHDFPVDWPEDHYVARRDFTKFLGLTSLAFVVGQFWIGLKSLRRRRAADPERAVAELAELPVGGSLVFRYPDEHHRCLLMRPDERTLLAYSQECTHLACAVVPRMREGVIHCPCHEGYFDLATGRPTAGPPRRPLPKIRLEVRGGTVYAVGREVSPT
jgi:nitrite reductase/ring-hydroxylating ferredoxin subunit